MNQRKFTVSHKTGLVVSYFFQLEFLVVQISWRCHIIHVSQTHKT